MKGNKCFGLLLALFTIFGLSLSVSSSVNAADNLDTTGFGLYYLYAPNQSYQWANDLLYNQRVTIAPQGGASQYWYFSTNTPVKGNYATIHAETNIVAFSAIPYGSALFKNPFVDLSYFGNPSCGATQVGVNVISSSASTYVTSWDLGGPGGSQAYTLTVYSDITLTGFSSGNVALKCFYGNPDYKFIINPIPPVLGNNPMYVYFEQNPMNITWTTNESEALAQQQISQNQTIINQNDTMVWNQEQINQKLDDISDRDNQDRDDLQNQSSDIDDSADSSQQSAENTGQTLLAAFSSFVTAITNARPSNCNIDMDLGNLDLGIVNFCQLSPPAPFQTIASIFMILFFVPLSIATARKVINLFRSFQE